MAGIYIHIPFCKKACHYCNFHFSTSLKYKPDMIKAICDEFILRSPEWKDQEFNTIYFGGGTPSLLDLGEMQQILECIYENYQVKADPEITLEANPDDLTRSKLIELKKAKINRLSIGVQAFEDEILKELNRAHTSTQSVESVLIAQDIGIENISIDLMFGLPSLSLSLWEKTLSQAIEINTTHISCYNLTLEERTSLWHFVNKGTMELPCERDQELQFYKTHEILCSNDFNHYELSNYCKTSYDSDHNSNYWNRTAYLGIGPSSHSFKDNKRRWNIANNQKYINHINANEKCYEEESLSDVDVFNEIIMLGLRTKKGIPNDIIEHHKPNENTDFDKVVADLIAQNILVQTKDHILLNEKAWYMSDYYSSLLFIS